MTLSLVLENIIIIFFEKVAIVIEVLNGVVDIIMWQVPSLKALVKFTSTNFAVPSFSQLSNSSKHLSE